MNRAFISIFLGLIILPLFLPLFFYVFTGQEAHFNDDMIQEYLSHGIFRQSILEYNRFPLWSSYIGGGYPLYAHPHDASMILPLWIPVLLFGEILGIKLSILLLYALGVLGMYLYTRKIFPPHKTLIFLLTLIYAVNPFFLRTVYDGNYNELFIFIFPAILFLYEKGKTKAFWLLISSLLMTSLVFFGKFYLVYSLLMLFLFVFIEFIVIGKKEKPVNFKPFVYFGMFILLVVCFSLVKIIPMCSLILRTTFLETRPVADYFKLKYFYILSIFLVCLIVGKGYVLLIRFFRKYSGRKSKILTFFNTFCIFLTLFLLYNSFFETQNLSKQPGARYLEFKVLKPFIQAKEFYQVTAFGMVKDSTRTEHSLGYFNFRSGIGTIDWYDDGITLETKVQPKYLITETDDQIPNQDYKGEAYIIKGEGEITHFDVEPNRLKLSFSANSPLTIVINQNYDPNWKSNKGLVKEYNGLISIETDALGANELTLVYSPKIFYISLFLSTISLVIAIYLLCYNKRFINFICYLKT